MNEVREPKDYKNLERKNEGELLDEPERLLGEASNILSEIDAKCDSLVNLGAGLDRANLDKETAKVLSGVDNEAGKAKSSFFKKTKKLLPVILLAFASSSEHYKPAEDPALANKELQKFGITKDQKRAYKPGISELLYREVDPFGYNSPDRLKNLFPNILYGRDVEGSAKTPEAYKEIIKGREDAWRMYLGLPQKHDTFGISNFRPTKSKDNKYYYKINKFWQKFKKGFNSDGEAIKFLSRVAENSGVRKDDETGIMGNYKVSLGQDNKGSFISYYDNWNLEGSKEGEPGFLGKPFEIYDRIYYNPETYVLEK